MNLLETYIVIDNIEKNNYAQAFMSVIILLETLRDLADQKRLATKALHESFSIVNLDNSIIEAYCRIYRVLKEECNLIPDADLIIATTAIAHDLTLETKDPHFHRLKALGLRLK